MDMKSQYDHFCQLDDKRTPGEWEAGCHPANERLNIVKPIMFGKYVGKLPDCEGGAVYFLHKGNADIIAQIPQMLSFIRLLWAQRETAEDALQKGWELSTWAGAINWRGGENQKEWLDDLRNLIESFQEAAKPALSTIRNTGGGDVLSKDA